MILPDWGRKTIPSSIELDILFQILYPKVFDAMLFLSSVLWSLLLFEPGKSSLPMESESQGMKKAELE